VAHLNYLFKQMTQEDAEIIASWKYDGDYSFYDITSDEEDFELFLDSKKRGDHYFAVYDFNNEKEELVGFFSFTEEPSGIRDIGLGMRPDLTGKGVGHSFIEAGLCFATDEYVVKTFTLSVATFNQRAIKVYERVGFQAQATYTQETNGGQYEFVKMKKVISKGE
jgi:ribosomal-protein-alanine N-acetyltransferase